MDSRESKEATSPRIQVDGVDSARSDLPLKTAETGFSDWRSTGKALEHPGVITWPIAAFYAALAVLSAMAMKQVSRDPAGNPHFPPLLFTAVQESSLLFLVWIVIRLFTRKRRLRHLERVQLEPGDAPVEIAIAKDGVVIGRDIGFLRFESRYLFFQGTSTSFSFSRRQMTRFQPAKRMNRMYLSGLPQKMDRVSYRVDGKSYELGISPLEQVGNERHKYVRGLNNWLVEKPARDGVDVFPPSTSSPTTLEEANNELAAPFFVLTLFANEVVNFFQTAILKHPWYFFAGFNWLWAAFWLWLFVAFSVLPAIRIYRRIRLAKSAL